MTHIQNLFDYVTPRYDVMNDLMSFGLHRYWKRVLISFIPQVPCLRLLDLASGTGDVAFSYLKKYPDLNTRATLCDVSSEMLAHAKERAINKNVRGALSWVQARAEQLPFDAESFDVCTVSFGLRNFTDRPLALREIYRVLKPGGLFLCLEFSQPDPIMRPFYDYYLSHIIPKMGEAIAQNLSAYTYLAESIQLFPDAEMVKTMIKEARFPIVEYIRLTKGITALHHARTGYR